MESTQALPPGTRIEEFIIERVLGSGGFGITYLARDIRLDRQVVIKENLPVQFCFRDPSSLTVAPRHTHGEDAENFKWSLENFSKEAAMLASLDHPGIVKVLRSFEAFGTAYFVMPFVDGLTLDELTQRRVEKPFTEEYLRGLLERVLAALEYLHDRGIYHRDIKPGNILITTEDRPVLIDFGSARQRLSERSMTVVESAGYTPFEQLQSRGNVGPWSDLYALAATLVKVMIGEAPPKANDRTMGDPWQPLASHKELQQRFSEKFLTYLDRALRLPIAERWQRAGEWNETLRTSKEIETSCIKLADDKSPKKSKAKWRFAMAAVLITVSMGCWWAIQKESGNPIIPEPATGGLVITSEPSGALVKDDDGAKLGTTPAVLKSLRVGKHWKALLELDGYVSEVVRADVFPGETKLVPLFKLTPQPQKVFVMSEPDGAEVRQGDTVIGITPCETEAREVNSVVELTLHKSGYEDTQLTGKVPFGKSLRLQEKLVPELQSVTVLSEPLGADVLEEKSIVGTTPFSVNRQTGETLSYTFRMTGYDDQPLSQKIVVGENQFFVQLNKKEKNSKIADDHAPEEVNPVEKNLEVYLAMAGKGDSEAMWKIGLIHEEGDDTPVDRFEALKWYKKSAENGNEEGMFLYGLSNEFGEGCAVDKERALYFYKMAADKGHEESGRRRERLELEMKNP